MRLSNFHSQDCIETSSSFEHTHWKDSYSRGRGEVEFVKKCRGLQPRTTPLNFVQIHAAYPEYFTGLED